MNKFFETLKTREFQTVAGKAVIMVTTLVVTAVVSDKVNSGLNAGLKAVLDKIHGAVVEAPKA